MKTIEVSRTHAWVVGAAIVLVLLLGSYGVYRYYLLATISQATIGDLENGLATASSTNASLNQALVEEQARSDAFQSEINNITSKVGTLTKIANTDPQLLAQYSKIYFLNENYIPSSLSDIPTKYTYDPTREYQFLTPVLPHLEDMLADAKDDGVTISVISAYRSFANQAVLNSDYETTFGSGANTFSAEQGYSEHQLGTAVDLTTPSVGATFTGFDKTPAYAWLAKNAYRYGFILSYPPGNVFYVFEPWHWRYVGVDLATYLHNHNENFYDLDQRTINTYLADFFD